MKDLERRFLINRETGFFLFRFCDVIAREDKNDDFIINVRVIRDVN